MNATQDVVSEDVRPYVEAVTDRIAGLPAERRDELLEDLTQHLTELAAEDGPPLDARLGQPAAFADEYLSSAGIVAPPPAAPPLRRAGRRVGGLGRRLAERPTTRAVLAFLPELRPAWWAARGYLVVAAWPALGDRAALPFPDVTLPGHRFTGTVLGLLAAAASVRLARHAVEGRHHRSNLAANAVGMVAAFLVTAQGAAPDGYLAADADDDLGWPVSSGYVTAEDGQPITNLWVYDAEGNLLDGVYVYDQDGRPVATPALFDPDMRTTVPLDNRGQLVTNRYPQAEERVFYDVDGTTYTVVVPPPMPVVPELPPPPATTSTTIVE